MSEVLQNCLKKDPKNEEYMILYSICMFKLNKFLKSQEFVTLCTEMYPDSDLSWGISLQLEIHAKDPLSKHKNYCIDKLVEFNPTNPDMSLMEAIKFCMDCNVSEFCCDLIQIIVKSIDLTVLFSINNNQ
ncbi:MAG: hypothetical protein MHPSP_003878 [Paramarteilia canceri]